MKRLLLSLLGLAAFVAATAQTNYSQSQIDSLNTRIAKLEKRAALLEKLKPAFQFSGYLQGAYDYSWDETGGTSTFHLRRARMTLQGDIYKGAKGAKADYKLQIDLCRQPVIVDLFARYQPVNQFGVQFGQFKIPLSIENSDYSALKLEFINYAQVVQRLSRLGSGDMTGVGSTGRDIGMKFYGGFIKKDGYSIINYEVGVFNGAGINVKDNNNSKDVVGRLIIQPLKLLRLAAYYQIGEGDGSLMSKYPAIFEGMESYNEKYIGLQRYGGCVEYSNKFMFLRSEYIGGNTGNLLSEGAYLAVGYKFLGKCSAGVRVDYFDENKRTEGCQMNYSAALSYLPWKFLRLQAEYAFQNYRKLEKSNGHALYFMVSAIF